MNLDGEEAHFAQNMGEVTAWFAQLPSSQKVETFQRLIDIVKDDTTLGMRPLS
jgi:hypothetical protein